MQRTMQERKTSRTPWALVFAGVVATLGIGVGTGIGYWSYATSVSPPPPAPPAITGPNGYAVVH